MSKITTEIIKIPVTTTVERKMYNVQLTQQEVYFLWYAIRYWTKAPTNNSDHDRFKKLEKFFPDVQGPSLRLNDEYYSAEVMFNKE